MEIGQQPMMQLQETKIGLGKNLLIKLGHNSVSLILSMPDGTLTNHIYKEFSKKIETHLLENKLDSIISESNFTKQNITNVKLIVCNRLSSIVPKNLFEEKFSLEYLKYNAKLLKNDFSANDKIEEIEAINIYIPFVNVNNYLIEKFGAFNYYHYSTILIKKLIKIANHKKTSFFVNLQLNSIQILIFKNKKLQLYNNFEIKEKEDIIYFLLLSIEQNKIDNKKTKISLHGIIKNDTYLLLEKFISNLEIIDLFKKKAKTTGLNNSTKIDYLIL
ncbi:DUF3822 family protein [Flavobacteriaceae bacterium]|jgi:hypothetical protein|nr:DUF3822 family protein [Flavobacteriaceae bacterium]